MSKEQKFQARIGYKGDLSTLAAAVSKDFHLGEYKAYKVVTVGYEDLNLSLATNGGKYFVKILNDSRNKAEKERYSEILQQVEKANIAHPKVHKSEQGYLHKLDLEGSTLHLFVMEFVEGKTFYDLETKPNLDEVRFLARQASLINSLDIKPSFVYDSWAEVNILEEYERAKGDLTKSDKDLVHPVVESFKKISLENLPHAFVHGDIISTNIMVGKDDKLWILDFSVANYYPRIQELAVLACDLLTSKDNLQETKQNLEVALDEYQKTIPLTYKELEVLPAYIHGAHAMHIIGVINNIRGRKMTNEDKHWLTEGRSGLELVKNWHSL